jgi:hypothetical protein
MPPTSAYKSPRCELAEEGGFCLESSLPEAVLTEETCTSLVQRYHLIAKREKRNQLTRNAVGLMLACLSKPRAD